MTGSDKPQDEPTAAAARVAADPAFAALESSGAPVVAATGDPLRIVYVNASAAAVFGGSPERLAERLFGRGEPCAGRLREIVESGRHGAAPRLERLRVSFPDAPPQTVTILCRTLRDSGGRSYFVIAALGVRPSVAGETRAPRGETAPPAATAPQVALAALAEAAAAPDADGEVLPALALRDRLAARHGVRAPRFLWKTDADDRFVDVTHVLADVVGDARADLLGRDAADVSRALGLGEGLVAALALRKSWSGVEVDWPLENAEERIPTTLGALPAFDGEKRFIGFQGYGVLHLSRALTRPNAVTPEPPAEPLPAEPSGPEFPAGNVVLLRPYFDTTRGEEARPEEAPAATEAAEETLTPTEKTAFDEIGRTLGAMRPSRTLSDNGERVGLVPGGFVPAPADGPEGEAKAGPSARCAAAMLELLPVGVLAAQGAEALYANRAMLDDLGYRDLAALQGDGGLARLFFGRSARDHAVRAQGRPETDAAEAPARDGETLDVDVHLQTVDWDGGPATLVTLRRHRAPARAEAEAAMRAHVEKSARAAAETEEARRIFDATTDAIAILGAEGRIDAVNAAFAALLCGEKRDFAGRDLSTLVAEEDARALAESLSHARAEGVAGGEALRLTVKPRRGGPAPVQAAIRRLGTDPRRMFVLSLRSGAPVPAANDELEAARRAAERASAAKSEFLARVSHEIRTPLNAIIGFAEVMMEERFGPIGSERYREYLRDVHASGALVLSLVNDLLDLSKIEAGKLDLDFERVDANAVIADSVAIMQPQANRARVVMRLALAERLPSIRADARSLKQILLNLLSNAVKFNEPGGQVIVSTALTDAGAVAIRVKDTGIGMSEEDIATALEPFGQLATSRKAAGTGLGLPVTKALIEANHASFTIRSRKGDGTLIEVAFPPPQVLAAE